MCTYVSMHVCTYVCTIIDQLYTEVDCVHNEEHAMDEDTKEVVATDDYCGETSLDQKMGGDEVDFHFQQPASLPPSFDTGHMKVHIHMQ